MVLRELAVQLAESLSQGMEGEFMIWTFGSQSVVEPLLRYWQFQHESRESTLIDALRSDAETGNWFLSCALKVHACEGSWFSWDC